MSRRYRCGLPQRKLPVVYILIMSIVGVVFVTVKSTYKNELVLRKHDIASLEFTTSTLRQQIVAKNRYAMNANRIRSQSHNFTHCTNTVQETIGHAKDRATYESSRIVPKEIFKSSTSEPLRPETEVRHIGFLKVHKAASSTMQNMFFRFGLKRNLTFVFTNNPNYFSGSVKTHLPIAKPKFRTGYDILCNHGIFNYTVYSSFLPKDTVYIAIVRDPLAVFISAVNYYSQTLQYIAKIPGNKVQELIKKPEVYDRNFFSYTKNVMARDFGFPESNERNIAMTKLNELHRIFRLVLIVEHFEESLVLMKRYLNWNLQDILFVPNNVYRRAEAFSADDLTSDDIETFKIRNKLDYDLYAFFHQKFWKQFQGESDDIQTEVLHLKKVLTDVQLFCNNRKKDSVHGDVRLLIIQQSEWNEQFSVTTVDCRYMHMSELKFIHIMRREQGSELSRPKMISGRMSIDEFRRLQRGRAETTDEKRK